MILHQINGRWTEFADGRMLRGVDYECSGPCCAAAEMKGEA